MMAFERDVMMMMMTLVCFCERRWVLLKIPRCDIDELGEDDDDDVYGRAVTVDVDDVYFKREGGFY